VTGPVAGASSRRLARIADVLYLVSILGGAFAIGVVPTLLFASDPATTQGVGKVVNQGSDLRGCRRRDDAVGCPMCLCRWQGDRQGALTWRGGKRSPCRQRVTRSAHSPDSGHCSPSPQVKPHVKDFADPLGNHGRQHPGARAALPVQSRRASSGGRHPWRVRPVPPNDLRDPSTQTRDNPISAQGGIVGWVACSAQLLSALEASGRAPARDGEPASRSSPERGFT
jgi:hypothetical protein